MQEEEEKASPQIREIPNFESVSKAIMVDLIGCFIELITKDRAE